MYTCQTCGKKWTDPDAVDNRYFCTRTCNGQLIGVAEAGIPSSSNLMDRLPFPLAYPWYMSLDKDLEPVKRVHNLIFAAYQAMRFTGLVLLSDYLESDASCPSLGRPLARMHAPHWAEWISLTDTLANFICKDGKFPFGWLAENWVQLAKTWKANPLSAAFTANRR